MARKVLSATAVLNGTKREPTLFGTGKDFARILKALRSFVSTDATRGSQHKLHVELSGPDIVFVATNGHTLACWTQTVQDARVWGEFDISVPDIEALIERYVKEDTLIGIDPLMRIVGATVLHAVDSSPFPPYKLVIPKGVGKVARFGLNPRYTVQAFESFIVAMKGKKDKEGAPIQPYVQISFSGDELDPITVTSPEVPQLRVVIMPVRL